MWGILSHPLNFGVDDFLREIVIEKKEMARERGGKGWKRRWKFNGVNCSIIPAVKVGNGWRINNFWPADWRNSRDNHFRRHSRRYRFLAKKKRKESFPSFSSSQSTRLSRYTLKIGVKFHKNHWQAEKWNPLERRRIHYSPISRAREERGSDILGDDRWSFVG